MKIISILLLFDEIYHSLTFEDIELLSWIWLLSSNKFCLMKIWHFLEWIYILYRINICYTKFSRFSFEVVPQYGTMLELGHVDFYPGIVQLFQAINSYFLILLITYTVQKWVCLHCTIVVSHVQDYLKL